MVFNFDSFPLQTVSGRRGSNSFLVICTLFSPYCLSPTTTGFLCFRPWFHVHNLLVHGMLSLPNFFTKSSKAYKSAATWEQRPRVDALHSQVPKIILPVCLCFFFLQIFFFF